MNTRNFTVRGDISCFYTPETTTTEMAIEGIEVQVWQKAPMEAILLGKANTDSSGEFVCVFKEDSPTPHIVEGKIHDVFIKAYYKGEELTFRPPSLLTQLIAYWKLDETTGGVAEDATGRGHTGVLSGTTPTWGTGKINNGLDFQGGLSGGTSSYVAVPTSDDFDFGTGDFTIACWMKPNNTSGSYSILDTGYGGAESLLIEFVTPDGVRLYISGGGAYVETYSITPGTWYYVVVRRIGTELEIIINLTSLGVITFADPISCPNSDMLIGKYLGGGENLDGFLDEIAIWKGRGLKDDEIAILYNSGAGLQYPFE